MQFIDLDYVFPAPDNESCFPLSSLFLSLFSHNLDLLCLVFRILDEMKAQ